MKKRVFSIFLALTLLLTILPAGAFAESREGQEIDFAAFLDEIKQAGYKYDGQGVTVKWSPSSACTDDRSNHDCLFSPGEAPAADGNNAQRIQKPNAQYQIFSGEKDISISNVNFVFVPAGFTLCMNSGWGGPATAGDVPNAELQLQNDGDVTFTNCSFDQVIVGAYLQGGKTTPGSTTKFDFCKFENIYDAYGVKDVYSTNLIVTGCNFKNCGGGIYMEGSLDKGTITIEKNTFTDIDTFAAEGKKGTRGLIQFSASGDYSSATITIQDNESTGEAAVLRQLNYTVNMDAVEEIISKSSNSFAGETFTDNSIENTYQLPVGTNFTDDYTVFDGKTYYKTMKEALAGIHLKDKHTLWCKPGADVGVMTHGHVCADLTVYGNGAYISSGERDFEVDTYNYCHDTSDICSGLTGGLTLTVYNLNGAAVWGQRTTEHTVNIVMQGCENMNRVYISGTTGKNNITIKDCTFDGTAGTNYNKANSCTVYSNAPGVILVENCSFTDVMAPVNLNNKAAAGTEQEITVKNCTFTNCSTEDICDPTTDQKQYAAPIRIVSSKGADSMATVDGCTFVYSAGKQSANGDILLGEGRGGKDSYPVYASIVNTAAKVQVQNPGDRTADANKGKETTVVSSDEAVSVSNVVARIGEKDYASLGDAIMAAESMTDDVTIKLFGDADLTDDFKAAQNNHISYDLSEASELNSLTICGASQEVRIISGVDGNDIDGPNEGNKNAPYCPVLSVKLPENAFLTVDNLTFPDDLLFDSPDGTVVVQNCVFNGAQSGYPQAKKISYLNNTFEFEGTADNFYSHNAYPVWYKLDQDMDFVFTGNTVIGCRGVHIETRGQADIQADITVNNNHFELEDTAYPTKCTALQLVRKVDGNVSFCDNYVDAYMAVCLFKGLAYASGESDEMTVENNYLVSGCKLFGSSEWDKTWSVTEADAFAESFMNTVKGNGGTVSEGHTKHQYVGGTCTICGRSLPSVPGLGTRLPDADTDLSESTFESDTTSDFVMGEVYQFRITSLNGAAPVMTVSGEGFRVELASQDGSDYFFKLYAGTPGRSAEVSVNGQKLLTVTAFSGVISDTTDPFTVAQGGAYQFRLTAAEKPVFAAGSPSFTVEFAGQIGNDWFFKVYAVGQPGDGCGFYVNGAATPVAVAHIAA